MNTHLSRFNRTAPASALVQKAHKVGALFVAAIALAAATLATPALAQRATGCWIDIEARRAERPSDHTFVVATFAL